jgi:hypothetical protein
VIAVAPKIAINLTSTKSEGTNSPASGVAPGKSFSTVLQETTQHCQSHAEDSRSSEANPAGSHQPTTLHSKTGHASGGSHEHSGTSDQSDELKPDSACNVSGSHPASFAVLTAQPQLAASTAIPVGTVGTIQTPDPCGSPNVAADQPIDVASASTTLGLAPNTSWSQSAAINIPTARPQPTDTAGNAITVGTVSAIQTQDSTNSPTGSLDQPVDMATASSTLASAALPSPWSQSAAITASATSPQSTGATSTGSTVETVGAIQMQAVKDDPHGDADQPTDGATSSPLLVSTSNSAVDNLSNNAISGSTGVALEAQAPDSKTTPEPSIQPYSAAVQSSDGKSTADAIASPLREQIGAAIAAAETSHLAAEAGSSTKAPAAASSIRSFQGLATKPAENVAPGANVTWLASHRSTVSGAVVGNSSTPMAEADTAGLQGLPLTAPANGASSKAQSPVDGAHLATDPGAADTSDLIATQVAATTLSKNAALGGNGNAQPSASQNDALSFVATQVSNQGVPNDAGAGARVSQLPVPSASSTPVQIAGGTGGSNESQAATLKADNHSGAGLPATSSAIANAENQAEILAASSGSLLHSAKLVERIGSAELRVGIQTGDLGSVDIRTSMVRNQFSAQISVERPELGKLLAAELPNLQNRLSEQHVPAANITLNNQSSGGSAGFGQESRQSQTMQRIVVPDNSEVESPPVPLVYTEAATSTARLDVHM